ncbi:hypothetical protein D3C87_1686310 [compost metagenome]
MKNTYPRIAAIPPDNVLITVTTDTEPATAPQANDEKPPRFIRLAPVSVRQFFSGGIFRPSSILRTIATNTINPIRYASQSIVTGPSIGSTKRPCSQKLVP